MSEAWEDILLEMDSKLMKFAEEKHKIEGGTVSNDFLRLLMFGTPSEELQAFLLHELTDKGLKKLGHSIETSYSNIQKLVLKHLQSVGQAIVYHLTDIRGMSLWYDKFGVLGLSTKEVHDAISTAGSFMLKASELQQVIDGSMKNFKAFFRWLYVVIKGLSDEQVPPELTKMTQQDLNFVAQFLKENFTEESDSSKSGFKLEKVGQYLKNEDLTDPPDNDSNLWVNFLQQTSTLNDDGLLYPAQPEKSLIQMHEQLKASVDTALNKCAMVIGQSLQCVHSYRLANVSSENEKLQAKVSQMSKVMDDESSIYTILTTDELPCKKCHLLRQSTTGERTLEICSLEFHEIGSRDPDDSTNSERVGRHFVQDLSFYDGETISALLLEDCEDGMPVLVQVPLAAISSDEYCQVELLSQPLTESTEICCVDAGSHVDNLNYRRLENMKASQFAVSGTRRVACVLFSSRRRVRLFLMDVEDEEDDDDDDEDEDEEADSSLQQQQQGDVSRGDEDESREDEGDEDKENSRESAMDV